MGLGLATLLLNPVLLNPVSIPYRKKTPGNMSLLSGVGFLLAINHF
jgi:hypothetical protein